MKKIIYVICLIVMSSFQNAYSQDQTIKASEKLTLSDAISISLKNNYDLIITQNSEKIAKINNTWGNTTLMPTLDFSTSAQGSKNYNSNEDYKNLTFNPKISLSWILFNGFSASINKANYVELEKVSEGNTALLVEITIQNIILSYNNSLLQKTVMNVYKEISDLSYDRMKKAEIGKELGNVTSYNYLLYKTSYLEDYSNYLKQKVIYENSIRTLNYNMGAEDNKLWELTTPLVADTANYKLDVLSEKLKSNNQTLKNQYINQNILGLKIKSAKNSNYPSLRLNASAMHNNAKTYYDGSTANRSSHSNEVGAGLTFSWNIFNGGTKKRALQIAKINAETGNVKIDQMLHSLTNQLIQLLSSYNTDKEVYNLSIERLKAAKLNLEISTDNYKNGIIDSFDYRDIQVYYLNAAIAKLKAAYSLIESKTDLMQITGNIVSYK